MKKDSRGEAEVLLLVLPDSPEETLGVSLVPVARSRGDRSRSLRLVPGAGSAEPDSTQRTQTRSLSEYLIGTGRVI